MIRKGVNSKRERERITQGGETIFHVAATTKWQKDIRAPRLKFLELVPSLPPK